MIITLIRGIPCEVTLAGLIHRVSFLRCSSSASSSRSGTCQCTTSMHAAAIDSWWMFLQRCQQPWWRFCSSKSLLRTQSFFFIISCVCCCWMMAYCTRCFLLRGRFEWWAFRKTSLGLMMTLYQVRWTIRLMGNGGMDMVRSWEMACWWMLRIVVR